MKPVISIVVPIYGVERYIEQCARSLFAQSYDALQFVFVNDGTKDRSMEILNGLIESEYSHLKDRIVIVDKKNGGLPAARRTGLEHVTGDYVYNVDPDDWISDGSMEKIASVAESTDADIIYFHYVKEYENRSSVKTEGFYTGADRASYVRNMYNHRAYGTLCNKCIKTSLFRDHQIFVPSYGHAEDCCISVQVAGYSSRIERLDEIIYHYRKNNPTSLTRNGLKRRKKEYAMNFLGLYSKYMGLPADENPIASIMDDIAIQVGWYSIFYGLGLFSKYDFLASAIRKARMKTKTDVWLPAQFLTKLLALIKTK